MWTAFKRRQPWAAAAVSFLGGPIIGMCYIGCGYLAVLYGVASISPALLCTTLVHFEVLKMSLNDGVNITMWVLHIIGTVHCYLIAKSKVNYLSLKWYSHWYSMVGMLVAFIAFSFLFRHFCYEPLSMTARSMSPTILEGDVLLAKKYAYYFDEPLRGDVILFQAPTNNRHIKRIVGLPGDKIQIKESTVYINDKPVFRQQIKDHLLKYTPKAFLEKLPEGIEYLVWEESDEAPWGNSSVFTVPAEHYFILGDNRDVSLDSWSDKIGFIPRKNIVGKASLIIWNSSEQKVKFKSIN